jgi:hypothetical protein
MKSTDIIKPTPLIAPIANDGLKNTIPDDATGSNYASIAEGFPEMTMKAPKDGGLPPWGQDFNGMFYLMSSQTCFLQNGGLITFDQDVSNKIGGYPQGAILDYMTPENTYVKVKSLIDDNTYNFVTTPSYIDGEHWEEITMSATTSWGDITGTLSNQTDLTDYVNQSKALETGAVSSDADVYADIQKYAHSTFDLSKFTVVGSPNITGDGMYCASENNYVRLDVNSLPATWGIKLKVVIPTLPVTHLNTAFFVKRAGNYNGKIYIRIDNNQSKVTIGYYKSDNTYANTSFAVAANTEHSFDIKVSGSNMTINVNGESYLTVTDLNTSENIEYISFASQSGANFWTVPFDLKYLEVNLNGIVFSGNKTGIDVIKPDNYEVVGTPTITEDGIASGFKSDSYIISTENFNLSAKKFKIKYHCKIGQPRDSIGVVGLYNKQGLPVINIVHNYYTVGVILRENSSGAGDISTYTSSYTGLSYTANFEIENNTVTINVLYDDGTTRTANVDFSELDVSSWGELQLRIGRCLWIGENVEYLDLNSVELENNGNLIYQPCLKIPYTESKTGSKIVDAAYRDRVQDMYEQYGYAPYYTIDEENENFTLPMGEIYGIIEQKKSNDGFSLFDTKLTDRILTGDEAVGWALQGALITMTYPDAVNKIKELYAGGTDTTFRGISCKKTTDGRYIADISQKTAIDNLFNTTSVADFYILDSTNSEFYLPRNNWFLQAGSDTGAVNNYNAPGLPGISGSIGKFDVYEAGAEGCFKIRTKTYGSTREQWGGTVATISFNASQSSSVYGASSSVQPPSSIKLLYYKVGNTVPNTGLIDIGHVLSDIQQLSKSYITETYINGSSWYRVWSDGWIEQGGRLQIQASKQASVNLMKPYSDTNYAAFCSHSLPGTGNQTESYIQQTSASVVSIGNSCGNEQTFTWMCAGK